MAESEKAASAAAELWAVSSSPHAHSGASVRRIMLDVIVALLPALAVAVWRVGWDAVRLVSVCVSACVLAEFLARRLMRRDAAIDDLSAVVTGILLAFNLPPGLPSWMAVVGSVVAIVVAKQIFGGLGYNPFNPALIGRVFLLVSFPVQMTTLWTPWRIPAPAAGVDAVTTATPLSVAKMGLARGAVPFEFDAATALQFFAGLRNGSLGEISALALLVGGVYLLYRRCICWQTPVFFIGTVAVFSGVLWALAPERNMNPLFHVLSGGLFLGAFFMATDMVTTPVTRKGMAIFGAGCGLITMIIRRWGGYPEGVAFSILLMNAFTPLINRACRPRVFGKAGRKSRSRA